jgi:hypothetical protein
MDIVLVVAIYAAVPAILIFVTISWLRDRKKKRGPGSPSGD